jgi:hypothetical protein
MGRDRSSFQAIAALVALGGAGLAAKAWSGALAWWVRDYLGGVIYVAFWTVLARTVFPRARPVLVVVNVLAATCALEALQLWKPPLLEAVRATWPGKALIGSTFSWLDFPHYFLGAWLGAWISGRVVPDSPGTVSPPA